MLNFGQALEQLKLGAKVAREGWNGKGMFIYKATKKLPFPPLPNSEEWKEDAFMQSDFLIMKTADKKLIPWLASQSDVLAEDWTIVLG